MKIEALNLSHQSLLKEKLINLSSFLSDYSFNNLYLFRHLHQYQVLFEGNEIFIQGITRDHVPFIMLTSHPRFLSPDLLKSVTLSSSISTLFPIPDEWLIHLEKITSQASFKEDDSDYLFKTSSLASFQGRHLNKKRNLVNQLLHHAEIEVKNLSDHLEEAKLVLDKWQKEHPDPSIQTDYDSCLEALQHFKILQFQGMIIFVDQQPAGFIMGEHLSSECYVLHFGKALHSIKGLNQYLFQIMARSIEKDYAWMNLEQDLGIPTLRAAKHSYSPERLLIKWRTQIFK